MPLNALNDLACKSFGSFWNCRSFRICTYLRMFGAIDK